MLTCAERELVQRDVALPGLEKLLDADAFRDVLQAAADMTIASVRLRYLRYKPTQNCLAAYTLNVGGAEVDCHAKAYRLDDASKLAKAEARADIGGPLGQGRFVWPHAGIEVCVFPNDNKLDSLPLLADAARREGFLRRHLPDQPDLWPGTVRTLAYKPERRWVGSLEVNGEPRAVCKLHGGPGFEAARARAKRFVPGDVLHLPPLLGRSKGRRVLFFDWLNGDVLSRLILDPEFGPAALQRVGVALWELQQQDVPALPPRLHEPVVGAAIELSEFISVLLPALGPRVRSLAEELATALRSAPAGNTTIHGDFYAKQILWTGDRVSVLDLDEAARGEALTDLGSFIAQLECEVMAGRMTAGRCRRLREELLAGYDRAGGVVDEARLNCHTAERLFARAAEFFRTRETDWPQLTGALVERVEILLASYRRGSRPMAGLDPKLPMLERALSPLVIEPPLTRLLSERDPSITGVTLRRVKLLRHKQGRRALVEYNLEVQRTDGVECVRLLGKLRRRGVDAGNLRLLRELGADRFAPDCANGVAIPEVFGTIAEFGITLQRCVAGQPLAELLAGPGGLLAARRAADAICKLHQSDVRLVRTHTIGDELEILDARFTALAGNRPALSARLKELLGNCHELAKCLPEVSPRPIHRDFYPDQLLMDGDRVWLLDLDLLCGGDPALDAGNFVGHLIERGVRVPSERAALEAAAATFTDRFLELSDGNQREVEIYTTLTLARLVSISVEFPGRAPFTEDILRLCEERYARATTQFSGQLAAISEA